MIKLIKECVIFIITALILNFIFVKIPIYQSIIIAIVSFVINYIIFHTKKDT